MASPAKKLPKAAPTDAAAPANEEAWVWSQAVPWAIQSLRRASSMPNGRVPSQATSAWKPSRDCSSSSGHSAAT